MTGKRGARRTALALGLAVALATPVGSAEEPRPTDLPPLPGSGALLPGAEAGAATLVATVREPVRLDHTGWAAWLEVEAALTGALAPGSRQRIGWEELSPRRPPRFTDGDRIIVALEPLRAGSLWTARFPRRDALQVAEAGRAFLRDPDPATIAALARYLSLEPDARRAGPGAAQLARLIAEADPELGLAAVGSLATREELGSELEPAGRRHLERTLQRPERTPELRGAVLALVAHHRLASLRPVVVALAVPGGPLAAEALVALSRIDGGLEPERVTELLGREESPLRAVAVLEGGAGLSDDQLTAALDDPAAEVRGAAVFALVARRGIEALPVALDRLFDPDAEVRQAASRSIVPLGDAAIPPLVEIVEGRPFEAPSELAASAATLALMGPKGVEELQRIAITHPDERVRKLARGMLGRLDVPH